MFFFRKDGGGDNYEFIEKEKECVTEKKDRNKGALRCS